MSSILSKKSVLKIMGYFVQNVSKYVFLVVGASRDAFQPITRKRKCLTNNTLKWHHLAYSNGYDDDDDDDDADDADDANDDDDDGDDWIA